MTLEQAEEVLMQHDQSPLWEAFQTIWAHHMAAGTLAIGDTLFNQKAASRHGKAELIQFTKNKVEHARERVLRRQEKTANVPH